MRKSYNYQVSIIIPTLGERDELSTCLRSIREQTVAPKEVIIVNDGHLSESTREQFTTILSCDLEITSSNGPASTSTARNTGAQIASSPIVLILDDDVVLGPSYLEDLIEVFAENDHRKLAGVGGFDSSIRRSSMLEQFYNRIFYLGYDNWRINAAGMQSWDPSVEHTTRSDWLSGNNASYKRELLLRYPFPHWSGGREPLEDVAIGMQLKQQGYHCLISPSLSIHHHQREDTETSFKFGFKRSRNRMRIFFEYGNALFTPLFLWALFGDVLRQFLSPFVDSKWRSHWFTGLGMLFGIFYMIVPTKSETTD